MNFFTPSSSKSPISIIDTTTTNNVSHSRGRVYCCNVHQAGAIDGFFEVSEVRGKLVATILRGGKYTIRIDPRSGFGFIAVARQLRDWVSGLDGLRFEDYVAVSRMIEAFIASQSTSPVSNFCTARNTIEGQNE